MFACVSEPKHGERCVEKEAPSLPDKIIIRVKAYLRISISGMLHQHQAHTMLDLVAREQGRRGIQTSIINKENNEENSSLRDTNLILRAGQHQGP